MIVACLGVTGATVAYNAGESLSVIDTEPGKLPAATLSPMADSLLMFVIPVVGILIFLGGLALVLADERPLQNL